MRRALVVIGLVLLVAVVGWLVYASLKPMGKDELVSHADPTSDREEALARWASVEARDDETIDPRCESWSLIHDEPVETTVVLLHGYTNCPYMYRRLGNDLHDLGWNVLAPREQYHGYVDKLSTDQGMTNARDLVGLAEESIDIAQGLGDRVVVGGISAGGAASAWVAQNRDDVDHVVGLAPMVNLRQIPDWAAPQVVNTVLAAPDFQIWWDLGKREAMLPDYGYPKFSTHAVAEFIRLGMATKEQARERAPGVNSVVLTTNAGDGAVKPETVEAIVSAWQDHGADASVYEWPAEWNLGHNMVDDEINADRFDEVYPILIQLFTEGSP